MPHEKACPWIVFSLSAELRPGELIPVIGVFRRPNLRQKLGSLQSLGSEEELEVCGPLSPTVRTQSPHPNTVTIIRQLSFIRRDHKIRDPDRLLH